MAPAHTAQAGYVMMSPCNYSKIGCSIIPHAEIKCQFNASNPVKLTYHPDGFAQFSSVKDGTIISGRDEAGNVKGVGLQTSPLSHPIMSGPVANICAWGLQDFLTHTGSLANTIVFDLETLECNKCSPLDANTFIVEIFTIPRPLLRLAKIINANQVVELPYVFNGTRRMFELRVIDIPDKNVFLGVLGMRRKTSFPSTSGWGMGGPGISRPDGTGFNLHALYPSPVGADRSKDLPSLDYCSDNSAWTSL